MAKVKKALALLLALCMVLGTMPLFASGLDSDFFPDADFEDEDLYSSLVTATFYRLDADKGEWVPTTTAKPGEDVKARVSLKTNYLSGTVGLLFAYKADMFDDEFGTASFNTDGSSLNTDPDSFADQVGFNFRYTSYKTETEEITIWDEIHDLELISDDIYNGYRYIAARMDYLESGNWQEFPGTEWFFEFDLTVKEDISVPNLTDAFIVVEDGVDSSWYHDDWYGETQLVGICNAPKKNSASSKLQPAYMFDYAFSSVDAQLKTHSTITLNANGGTLSGDADNPELVGSTYTFPTTVASAPTGKSTQNVKWSTDPDCAYADALTSAEVGYEDETYYAIYDNASGIAYTVNTYEMKTDGTYTGVTPTTSTQYGTAGETVDATALAGYTVPTGFSLDTDASTVSDVVAADGTTELNVYFKRNTYKAIWNTGDTSSETTGLYGAAITAPSDPTPPAGMSFDGWAATADGAVIDPFTGYNFDVEDTNFYAKFSYNAKDIAFDVNGGTWALENVETRNFDFGAAITAPAEPTKTGYTFAGWADAADATTGSKTLGNVTVDTPATYYAVYTPKTFRFGGYTVWDPAQTDPTQAYSGGTANVTVTFGSNAKLLSSQLGSPDAVTGYTFSHWSDTPGGDDFFTNGTYTLTGTEAARTQLYPVYTINEYKLTVNYSGAGDATPTTHTEDVAYGATYTVESPAVIGYTADPTVVTGTMGTSNVERSVVYTKNQHAVKFLDADNSVIKSETLYFGDNIVAPANPTKEGYTFAGWDTAVAATVPDEDVTYTATYTKNSYTVTYIVDGVEKTDLAQTIAYGDPLTFAAKPAAPSGKTMSDWSFFNADTEAAVTPGSTMPAYNIKAVATSSANNYTIKYYVDDTEIKDLEQTLAFGSAITHSVYTPAAGYGVSEWTGDDAALTEMPDHDMIMTAMTYKLDYDVTIFVKSDIDDDYEALDSESFTAQIGDKILAAALENAAEDGEVFGYYVSGWSTTPDGTALEPDADGAITVMGAEALDLYAVYAPKAVTATFIIDLDSDDPYNEVYVDFDFDSAITPPTVRDDDAAVADSKPGYELIEWYKLDENDDLVPVTDWSEEIVNDEDSVMFIYVGHWEPADLTLTVNYSGAGTATPAKDEYTVKYEDDYSYDVPEVTGYTPNVTKVEGTMDDVNGKTVDVVYTVNEYDVEVTYTGAKNNPEKYTGKAAYGTTYNVETPSIDGYTADKAVVTGTMGTEAVKATVTYTPINYTLTISYQGAGAATPATETKTVAFDSDYSYDVPDVLGYTPDKDKVTGTMDTVGGEVETVTYTPNEYELTVNYSGAGAATPEAHTEDVAFNASYTVNTPAVTGYTPDIAVVTGTMDTVGGKTVEVKYTANKHFVKYVIDGAPFTQVEYSFGDTINYNSVTAPSVTGSTFSGWDLTSAPATMPDEDVTVTGTYTVNKWDIIYMVDYDDGNGYVEFDRIEDVPYDTELTGSAFAPDGTPTKTGSDFSGWSTLPDTMPNRDVTIKGSFGANRYTLTVNFEGAKNNPTTYTEDVVYGSTYEYDVPVIDGYTASTDKVEGTMDDVNGKTVTVTYTPNDYTLTVTFEYADGETAATDYTETVAFDSSYSYDVPAIPGYTASTDKVEGTMETVGGETVKVTYTPNNYTLTVSFEYADGEPARTDYTEEVAFNSTYSYDVPGITGYTASTEKIEGTMDDINGKTATVIYTPNNYTLTVNFAGAGDATPTTYTEDVAFNSTYSYDVPAVTGYTPDVELVEGIMNDINGKTVNVTYTPNNYALTINYVDEGGNPVATAYTADVAYNSTYSVDNPAVEGYSTTTDKVEGTMDDINGKTENVLYTKNQYTVSFFTSKDGGDTYTAYKSVNEYDFGETGWTEFPGTLKGYSFSGWTYYNAETGEEITKPVSIPAYDVEAKGIFTANEYTLTVTFDGAKNNPVTYTEDVTYGTEYSYDVPAVPGYTPSVEKVEGIMDNVNGKTAEVTYTPNNYTLTVSFEYPDGETAATDYTEEVAFDSDFSYDVPVIPGYTASTDKVEGTMDTVGGETVKVTYTPNNYTLTVSFEYPDGEPARVDYTEDVAFNSTYSYDVPAITGYTPSVEKIEGTMDSVDGKAVTVTYTPNDYELTVIYQYADGTEAYATYTEDVAYNTGYEVNSPAITGYTADIETVTGTMDSVGGKTVTVTYTADKHELKVIYTGAGAATPAAYTANIAYGDSYKVTTPDVTGYSADIAKVEGTMGTDDVEVTVTYTANNYTVTFDANGGNFAAGAVTEVTAAYGSTVTAPEVSKQGYEFAGWAPAFTGKIPAENTTYVAQWSDGTTTPYTVEIYFMNVDGTYDDDPTATITGNQGTTGSFISLSTTTNIPKGYTYDADNSEPDGIIAADGSLVLSMYYARKQYTITFDGTETTAYHGAAIKYPTPATEPGETFLGWSKLDGATEPDADLPVYAESNLEFFSVIDDGKFTISYFVDNGSGYELDKAVELAYGAAIEEYIPTKTGYTFSGWNEAVPATMPAEDLVRYASFTVNTYQVKYISDIDNSIISTATVAYGEHVPTITAPEVEYYTFREFSGYVDTMPNNELIVYVCYDRVPVRLIPKTPEASTIIDRDRYLVYGLDDYMTYNRLVDEFLDVEGDGYMVITPFDTYNGIGLYGTGSIVNVYDRVTGELVESFTIVIFGDLNGDGRITSTDTSILASEVAGVTEWSFELSDDYNEILAIAADVDHNGLLSPTDNGIVLDHVATIADIDQCPDLTSYSAPV